MKTPLTLTGLPSTRWTPIADVPFLSGGKNYTLPQILWNATDVFFYQFDAGWFQNHHDPRVRKEVFQVYEWSRNAPMAPEGFLWEYHLDHARRYRRLLVVSEDSPAPGSPLIIRSAKLDMGFAVAHGNGGLHSIFTRQLMQDLRYWLSGKPKSRVRKELAERLVLKPIPISPLALERVRQGFELPPRQ